MFRKILLFSLITFLTSTGNTNISNQLSPLSSSPEIRNLIKLIKNRVLKLKYNWDMSVFVNTDWQKHGKSVNGKPLIYWTCGEASAKNRSLIISSVHGDEVTPLFFGFRVTEWLKARPELCKNKFIVVAPLINPDGVLRYRKGTRTNFNKVDLNRNFDTPDWKSLAHKKWKQKLVNGKPQRRYYPGDKPETEPEIHFQKWLIDHFKPTKIMSVHSPLKNLDFDGPNTKTNQIFAKKYVEAVESMRSELKKSSRSFLNFYIYGVFPGSLGNYAGKQKGIPTITAELPSTNPGLAAKYFGELEKSTLVFLNYDLTK